MTNSPTIKIPNPISAEELAGYHLSKAQVANIARFAEIPESDETKQAFYAAYTGALNAMKKQDGNNLELLKIEKAARDTFFNVVIDASGESDHEFLHSAISKFSEDIIGLCVKQANFRAPGTLPVTRTIP